MSTTHYSALGSPIWLPRQLRADGRKPSEPDAALIPPLTAAQPRRLWGFARRPVLLHSGRRGGASKTSAPMAVLTPADTAKRAHDREGWAATPQRVSAFLVPWEHGTQRHRAFASMGSKTLGGLTAACKATEAAPAAGGGRGPPKRAHANAASTATTFRQMHAGCRHGPWLATLRARREGM